MFSAVGFAATATDWTIVAAAATVVDGAVVDADVVDWIALVVADVVDWRVVSATDTFDREL
ncbi:hypothetical protein DPMN_156985 [Dreissena polymorpha]|uniref:Uncharacterized protein n=1 Tax=Dreissena polymorpha TaxID=45954 RepID=A0A9D4FWM4_DREPO|nr:hypothetical protein DPMN_156985 [Dreissena polymorpha]